jgi:ribosomal protein S27E
LGLTPLLGACRQQLNLRFPEPLLSAATPIRDTIPAVNRTREDSPIPFATGFRITQQRPIATKTIKTMKTCFKFNCIYCGQHMECHPRFAGRQILCPVCSHRIVIPTGLGGKPSLQPVLARSTWDTDVPMPKFEIPTRYRNRTLPTPALA